MLISTREDISMNQSQFIQLITDTVLHYINIGNSMFEHKVRSIDIKLDLKGSSAGLALTHLHSNNHIIRLNAALMENNLTQFIDEVIPHEVAHIFAESNNPLKFKKKAGHGNFWKLIMKAFGIANPTRCHDMIVEQPMRKVVTKYTASCECKIHTITSHRRTKMINGTNYSCTLCNARLKLV